MKLRFLAVWCLTVVAFAIFIARIVTLLLRSVAGLEGSR